jgi:hypothetical protein
VNNLEGFHVEVQNKINSKVNKKLEKNNSKFNKKMNLCWWPKLKHRWPNLKPKIKIRGSNMKLLKHRWPNLKPKLKIRGPNMQLSQKIYHVFVMTLKILNTMNECYHYKIYKHIDLIPHHITLLYINTSFISNDKKT